MKALELGAISNLRFLNPYSVGTLSHGMWSDYLCVEPRYALWGKGILCVCYCKYGLWILGGI